MNILRFLREQARGYDCNVCGQNHARSEIRVLGRLETAWIVRVTCAKCQAAFKLLVVVDEAHAAVSPVEDGSAAPARTTRRRRPPVTPDEVLDAHELLKGFEGDVRTLFRRGERALEPEPDKTR
ncbi:MAG: hypothetical protein FJ034_04940 [Chloroflexi bacterium]|nr:hypothetical protein [Chloroflexota bacterium]